MNKLLAIKTKRWVKHNKSIRSATTYSKSDSIGLIFTIDDKKKHDVIKDIIKRLEEDGKSVSVLAHLPEKRENHEFLFDFFTKKDISFWGNYKPELVHNFISKPFDYLLHIDLVNSDLINGILAQSKAKCRVGIATPSNSSYYELMVSPEKKEIQNLVDEMYRYVSILNQE